MKKIYTLVILTCLAFTTFAQSPGWAWAKSYAGYHNKSSNKVAIDSVGNEFIIGSFSDTLTFGALSVYSSPAGNNDIYVAKFDPSGTPLWVRSAGGTDYDDCYGIAVDREGNVIISGDFYGAQLIADTDTIYNPTPSYTNAYIIKYNGNGNVMWAKSIGGIKYEQGLCISTDHDNNILVGGDFTSASFSLMTTTLTNNSTIDYADIFVVKYDPNGNELWAKSAGGTFDDYIRSASSDADGNFYISGPFSSPSITFGTTVLTLTGGTDFYLVKYDPNGNVAWAKSFGGTGSEDAYGMSADTNGNEYVTGYFNSTSLTIGATTLNNSGNYDIFTAKFDSSGNAEWAKALGGSGQDGANAVATDHNGNVYITGYTGSDSITIGTTNFSNHDLTSPYSNDLLIVKYDNNGNVLLSSVIGGPNIDVAYGVACNNAGNAVITGLFYSNAIDFGSIPLTIPGGTSIFLAKTDITTGILQSENFNETTNIFPNPASHEINISSSEKFSEIKIFNVMGEKIYQTEVAQSTSSFNLQTSNFRDGVYFVQLKSGSTMTTQKLVIQH